MPKQYKYDYLIVGAGLFGATFAYLARQAGKTCLVIDEREHIGGNCYTEDVDGITIHRYGPHIFHTRNKKIWEFVHKFAKFNSFRYRVKAYRDGKFYSFPINLMTMHEVWGVKDPVEAKEYLKKVTSQEFGRESANLKDWCINNVGVELYNFFVDAYTTKQWGIAPEELPASVIKRLPLRFTFSDYYFDDYEYQGIPIGGYTQMIQNMLFGIEVRCRVDYFKHCWASIQNKTIFTGRIDKFFNYEFGRLPYRSLKFYDQYWEIPDKQGIVVINYTGYDIPFTRSIEHKHFEFGNQPYTIVTQELSTSDGDPFYPVPTDENVARYKKYKSLSLATKTTVLFGGRLAEYKYMNMDQVIESAFNLAKEEHLV